MYEMEFGIVHEGRVVNELSRAVLDVRLVCPGDFIVRADSADEVPALDNPTDAQVESVLGFLRESNSIAEVELLERTPDAAFVHLVSSAAPAAGPSATGRTFMSWRETAASALATRSSTGAWNSGRWAVSSAPRPSISSKTLRR